MSNVRDFTKANPQFTGTEAMKVPTGSTAQRPSAPPVGYVRYNTDLGFLEQYNSTGWAGIDAPPTVSTVTGTINEDTDSVITVTGSNFKTGSSVSIEGPGVSNLPRSLATTFVSSGELTAATAASSVNYVGGASFSVKVSNPSGLSAILEPAGTVDRDPVWSTAAGNIGTVFDSGRSGFSTTVTANDPDGGGIVYSLVSGSLPGGCSLNTSNGTISGNISSVGSDTTYTFTIGATSSGQTEERTFNIIVKGPFAQTFTYTGGEQTFTVPSGVGNFTAYVWGAGGGTGSSNNGTYGGAGGFSSGTISASAGQTYRIIVGGGGNHSRNASTSGGYGGGGGGGNPAGREGSSSGGGYSGVFFQNTTHGNSRIIAGGGGGGAGIGDSGGYAYTYNQTGFGGSGGGSSGQNATGSYASANGGTQSSGGGRNGNTNNGSGNPTSGGQLQGGTGGQFISSDNHSAGGGGGGGYYGGGGGRGGEGGITAGDAGGGGSGYIGGVSGGTYSNGQGAGQYNSNNGRCQPPETGNTYYPGSNVGTSGTQRSTGGNGAVVLVY